MDVSLLIPAHRPAEAPLALRTTLQTASAFLTKHFPKSEIIVIPNPYSDSDLKLIESWHIPLVVVCRSATEAGKGFALRTGVHEAAGKWIFFTDADLPYDLKFFTCAARELENGSALVVGNRRLPGSRYLLSVESLGYASKRLWWSLWFSRITNGLLGLGGFDTQAGIKAMTLAFARDGFARIKNDKFHFDLELFLFARASGAKITSLPVVFTMRDPASTLNLRSQLSESLFWLSRFLVRKIMGAYR